MLSLLPTCCGSTQPASEPTAKVRVPPDVGLPLSLPEPSEPDPQAVSSTPVVRRAVRVAHRGDLKSGSAVTSGSPTHVTRHGVPTRHGRAWACGPGRPGAGDGDALCRQGSGGNGDPAQERDQAETGTATKTGAGHRPAVGTSVRPDRDSW